jgi:hypothetical protein
MVKCSKCGGSFKRGEWEGHALNCAVVERVGLRASDGRVFLLELFPATERGLGFMVKDASLMFVGAGDFPLDEITAENIQTELTALGYAAPEDQLTLALLAMLKVAVG